MTGCAGCADELADTRLEVRPTPIKVATPSATGAAIRSERMFFLSCSGSGDTGGLVAESCEHEKPRSDVDRLTKPFPRNARTGNA